MKQILNRTEAADYLGFNRKTLEAWEKQGVGPSVIQLPNGNPGYCIRELDRYAMEGEREVAHG